MIVFNKTTTCVISFVKNNLSIFRRYAIFMSLLCVAFSSFISTAESVPYTTIAISGQAAPGTEGRLLPASERLYNGPGEVAFTATLSGDAASNNGIWAGPAGSMQIVAQAGGQAPGAQAGTNFSTAFKGLYSVRMGVLDSLGFFWLGHQHKQRPRCVARNSHGQ